MPEFPSSVRSVRFGVFEIDLRAGELRKRGIRIKLQGQPFLLLITLLKQRGELVTREELRNTLWPGTPSLISTTAWAQALTNFARCWEIRPPIPVSSKPCRGEATGLSLRSRLSA